MKLMSLALVCAMTATGALAQAPDSTDNRIDLTRPDAPELAAPGDRVIGVRTLEVTNPGQLDILNVTADAKPTYDRPLTLEVWYPAAEGTEPGGVYKDVILRDGHATADIRGRAARDAEPASDGPYPLVIISHGYPGNRFLMSHLGENLATKGYVAVSIDHAESTYENKAAFGSTLVNRPLDQKFVLEEMARLAEGDGFLKGLVDVSETGLVGYSMGGYGAVISAGGGVAQEGIDLSWGAPEGTLAIHKAGSETHEALIDDRIKAIVAIGPWGWNRGFWTAEGLAGVRKPILYVAGSQDETSGYEPGVRTMWQNSTGAERWLLTFENAGHNAAAPMPAPVEAWAPSEHMDFVPAAHYQDAVWDQLKMNNILQHFTTAFLDWQLKGEAEKAEYLDLIEDANAGVVAVNEDGTAKPENTQWKGFEEEAAKGLRLEHLAKGE